MSKTATALLVKGIMTFVFAEIALAFMARNSSAPVIWVALAATALNYVMGDLLVLPTLGNLVAALGDGVMAALTAYVFAVLIRGFNVTFASLVIFGVLVAIGEYFFHQYLLKADKVAP